MVLSSAGTPVVMVVTFWKWAASMIFVTDVAAVVSWLMLRSPLRYTASRAWLVVVDEGPQRLAHAAVLLVDDELHPLGIGEDLVGGWRLGEGDALLGQVVGRGSACRRGRVTGDGPLEQDWQAGLSRGLPVGLLSSCLRRTAGRPWG